MHPRHSALRIERQVEATVLLKPLLHVVRDDQVGHLVLLGPHAFGRHGHFEVDAERWLIGAW